MSTTRHRSAAREPDGWSRSQKGNPYVTQPGVHATLYLDHDAHHPEWVLLARSHGHESQTRLGPGSEDDAKRLAEQHLNISHSMLRTRLARCRKMIRDGTKAPPAQRDEILDRAARLAANISAEIRCMPEGSHCARHREQLSQIIQDGTAARKAATML